MRQSFSQWLASGNPWIWLTAGAVSLSLVMVCGLLVLIAANGLAHFWPRQVALVTLQNAAGEQEILLGERVDEEYVSATRVRESGVVFPEGMAVGVAWGAGGPELGLPLAIGIGLQNIPEGFAAATVMRSGGASPKRSALVGAATGLVEPPAAVAAFLLVQSASFLLTPALAFAAAAMIYVVADELIPESQHPGHESKISLAFLTGFLIMMTLDLLLA